MDSCSNDVGGDMLELFPEEELAISDKERQEDVDAEVEKDKRIQANAPKPKAPAAK